MNTNISLLYIFFVFLPFFGDGHYELPFIFFIGACPFLLEKFNIHVVFPSLKRAKYLFLLTSLTYIFFQYKSLRNIEGASLFLATLFILKLWEKKSKRDTFLFLLIGLLFMVAKFLLHQAPLLLIYLLFISFLFLTLTSFTSFKTSIEGESKELKKGRFKSIGNIFITSIPLAIFLFFFFPRIHLLLPFGGKAIPTAQTGFSHGIQPGDFESLITNKDEVFKAHFVGPSPKYQNLYWRGVTLSFTDGFAWKKLKAPFKKSPFKRKKKLFEYQLEYIDTKEYPLFTLAWAVINHHSPGKMKRESGQSFSFKPRRNSPLTFKATSYDMIFKPLSQEEKNPYLQLPSTIGSKTKSLSKRLKGKTPQKTISNIIKYFHQNNYSFNLSPGRYLSKNPLEEFLFQRKSGYCEHFASSMAILLRLNGIPTRLVGGFMGGSYNNYGNYFVITNEDAHAWPEVWINNSWHNVDPTPTLAPVRINFGANAYFLNLFLNDPASTRSNIFNKVHGLWRQLALQLDFFYYKFNHFFSHYNFSKQTHLLKPLFDLFPISINYHQIYILVLAIIIFSFVLIGLLSLFSKFSEEPKSKLDKSFKRLCKKIGHFPIKGEGPCDFKKRLEMEEELNKKASSILDFYIRAKYSPSSVEKSEIQSFINKINMLNTKK